MRLVFKNKMVLIGTEIPSSADFYLATVNEIVIGRSQYKLINSLNIRSEIWKRPLTCALFTVYNQKQIKFLRKTGVKTENHVDLC